MSASAFPQEPVLSGTWGQNLDLTIPSLEMPSTLVLDSRDKQEIMMGWTCCYRKTLIDSVHQEHFLKSTEFWSKEKQRKLPYTLQLELSDPPSDIDWSIFIALQILDVWTTHRALKYDCIKEANPFLGERPSVERMMLTKVAIITPSVQIDLKSDNLKRQDFRLMNRIMGFVVVHNYNLGSKAQHKCNKR